MIQQGRRMLWWLECSFWIFCL